MNGIASLLDKPATSRVETLWQELEARCGLVGVKTTPFPHLTWQVTENYVFPRLEAALHALASQATPFIIHTAGLGLFTGAHPILYITIVKDEQLMRFHSLLWEQMNGIAFHPVLYFSPGHWVPHITLAYNDITPANLDCVMQFMAFQSFDLNIQIDNLILVTQGGDQPPVTVRYPFGL
ncbi:MAG: 2'-5' RNA ligase family protein [Anaerolineales bacterium]|jgi:2'-5' RNA ligase